MKKAILHALIYLGFGILATAAFLAIMTLCLAMPSILEWLAGYIGTATTWILFIFVIGAVITYCIAE